MFTGFYARLIGIAVILFALLGTAMYVRSLRAEIKTLSTENTVLSQRIEIQNAAVDEYKKEADKRLTAAAVELKRAKVETAKANKRANDFYRAKPSTPADDCKSTLDLINSAKPTLDLINNPDAVVLPEESK